MLMTCELRAPSAEMMQAALDAVTLSVILTDPNGLIIHMNASAARLIASSGAVSVVRGRLTASDRGASGALIAAIAATSGGGAITAERRSLALPDPKGIGLVATVVPLDRMGANQLPFAATAAVILKNPNAALQCPGDAFGKLYGLTQAELRVALAMMSSPTVKEAAGTLGISPETAKTHLQHIFQKTRTTRRADLLGLMWRVSALAA